MDYLKELNHFKCHLQHTQMYTELYFVLGREVFLSNIACVLIHPFRESQAFFENSTKTIKNTAL